MVVARDGRRWALTAAVVAVVAATLIGAAPRADAAVGLKTAGPFYTQQGNCLPATITPGYSQIDNTEPRVGDVFWLSLRVDVLTTFDCAADFISGLTSLPPNVVSAATDTVRPVCRRFGVNGSGQTVYDTRAQTNCPPVPVISGGNQLSLRPVDNPVLPDVGGPAGSYWFAGIRAPQESQEYPSIQILMPVRATATMTNAPVSTLVCTVGTSCTTATVPLTVTAAPPPLAIPRVTFAPNVTTSAIGASVPFTVTNTGELYDLRENITPNPTSPGCPTFPAFYAANPPWGSFPDDGGFTLVYGEFDPAPTPCLLDPQTAYQSQICTVDDVNNGTVFDCEQVSFTTGAVLTNLGLPGTDPQPSADLVGTSKVVGGHPAGTLAVERRTGTSGAWSPAAPTQAVGAAVADSVSFAQALSGLEPWRTNQLRVCFTSAVVACGQPVDHIAGSATADSAASDVTATSAVVRGRPSTPHPAGTLSIRVGTSDPGGADPRTALAQAATLDLAADGSTTPGALRSLTLGGLSPSTTYWWSACFDNPAEGGIEDCSPVNSFATAAAPVTPPPPPPPTAPDTVKPTAKLTVRGVLRVGRRVTLRVIARDASGIRRVTIKVGKRKPVAKRRLVITLPKRPGVVPILVRVVDRAGNVRVVRRNLRVRR